MSIAQHRPLEGLRIIECSSFVAGPSGCMTLGALGADVIRVDPLGGAADHRRWPVSIRTGESLFWTALNRGKKSVAVNMRDPAGRELVAALATAPGSNAGIVVDNSIGGTWLNYEALTQRRPDVIQVHIQGHSDGRAAVDYTVNAEVGVPDMTGPVAVSEPVNHVLPAWDLLTGMTAVTGLLAALRHRDLSGEGSLLSIALADVALSGLGSMGWLAEATERGDRPKQGNYLYGSFGVDFATDDQHRVMVVALTARQWSALLRATKTDKVFRALEEALEVDLSDEAERYRLRETVAAVLRPWFEGRSLEQVTHELDAAHVLWGRYRTLAQTVNELTQTPGNTVIIELDQPGIGLVTSARSPIRVGGDYADPRPAPRLGQHTEDVLATILGLGQHEIASLHDKGIIGDVA